MASLTTGICFCFFHCFFHYILGIKCRCLFQFLAIYVIWGKSNLSNSSFSILVTNVFL